MENIPFYAALSTSIIFLVIVVVIWRSKKHSAKQFQQTIAELDSALVQKTDKHQQLLLNQAVMEEKLKFQREESKKHQPHTVDELFRKFL